jgi:putative transposase
MDIVSLFSCFHSLAPSTATRQLVIIAQALLTISGRITMLSISRWSGRGGSYRTIQRFFATHLRWPDLLAKFFETHLFDENGEYLLAGDATTVGKAGRQTYGIDRFFSSVLGKAIPGLEFFVFSVVSLSARKAYPVAVKQTVRTAEEKAATRERKERKKIRRGKSGARRGRPPGRRNKAKGALNLSSELTRISALLNQTVRLLGRFVKLKYLALDGYFGHWQVVLMTRAAGLQLISKLRSDTRLFEPFSGHQSGRGRRRKYGARLRLDLLPVKYLKKSQQTGQIVTLYYQGVFLHPQFDDPISVVIIRKLNRETQKAATVVLFSSDPALEYEKVIDYYSLRFQIEFNFREAKQNFGLADFMTKTEVGIETAANLSFLMINVSAKLLEESKGQLVGINDLKTHYRGMKYALETIKLVLEKPESILIEMITEQIGQIGSIHHKKVVAASA